GATGVVRDARWEEERRSGMPKDGRNDRKTSALTSAGRVSRRGFMAGAAVVGAAAAMPLTVRRSFAQDRVTLKVMSWEQFQPGEKDGWNALFDKFNQSQSKYKVEWTGWPVAQYAANVVIQAQAGGIDADVLMGLPDLAAQMIRKYKVVEPLDPIVKDL